MLIAHKLEMSQGPETVKNFVYVQTHILALPKKQIIGTRSQQKM